MVCDGLQEAPHSKDSVMAEDEQAPPDVDIHRPNMARMYDYALGGKDMMQAAAGALPAMGAPGVVAAAAAVLLLRYRRPSS